MLDLLEIMITDKWQVYVQVIAYERRTSIKYLETRAKVTTEATCRSASDRRTSSTQILPFTLAFKFNPPHEVSLDRLGCRLSSQSIRSTSHNIGFTCSLAIQRSSRVRQH